MNDSFVPLIHRVLSGLNITRWNTFPRVREITSLDHLVFVAHISIFLALESGEKYAIGNILRKVLFGGFFTFYYSDMSSELKYRIREHHGDMIGLLEKNMIQAILEEIPHERIRSDFTQSYLSSPEDDLIACAKSWASYYEVYNNSLVFPDAYAKLLKNIEKRAIESPFWRMNHILDFDPHNQTQIEKFLLMIHRLASSYRWNQSRRSIPVSVLSHTYIITFFSYLIGIHEDLSDEDITDMLLTALYHDMPEAITGDIITPTKKAIPGLEHVIESIEQEMVDDYLLSYIHDREYHPWMSQKMLHPWNEKNGQLVKLADHLSVYYEADIESSFSQSFFLVKDRIRDRISDYSHSSHYISKFIK